MAFIVNTLELTAGERNASVYELIDEDRKVRAEVWPAWGFNCLRWQINRGSAGWGDLLYVAPDWETNPVPTRSGHPILFPFPGRMKGGAFTHEGKKYQLPLNDSLKQNAIHGFTPRNPWRVTDFEGGDEFAFITGQFRPSKDLPAQAGQWPGDISIDVTYRLYRDKLRVDAKVENRSQFPLPFGLGYHAYFQLPGVKDADVGGCVLQANVDQVWRADESNLPTGWRDDVSGEIDFREPRAIGGTHLDYVFTNITAKPSDYTNLVEVAVLSHPDADRSLRVMVEPAFRELVLFTPPHRQAVAIEPYSCSADAANLFERGIDSGWKFAKPGEEWEAAVEYRWQQ